MQLKNILKLNKMNHWTKIISSKYKIVKMPVYETDDYVTKKSDKYIYRILKDGDYVKDNESGLNLEFSSKEEAQQYIKIRK